MYINDSVKKSDQSVAETLYKTKHNTHNRQISMPPVGFETTISAGERPKTYVLDCAATGTGSSANIVTRH
jgi:hypothetical protein